MTTMIVGYREQSLKSVKGVEDRVIKTLYPTGFNERGFPFPVDGKGEFVFELPSSFGIGSPGAY